MQERGFHTRLRSSWASQEKYLYTCFRRCGTGRDERFNHLTSWQPTQRQDVQAPRDSRLHTRFCPPLHNVLNFQCADNRLCKTTRRKCSLYWRKLYTRYESVNNCQGGSNAPVAIDRLLLWPIKDVQKWQDGKENDKPSSSHHFKSSAGFKCGSNRHSYDYEIGRVDKGRKGVENLNPVKTYFTAALGLNNYQLKKAVPRLQHPHIGQNS